MLLTLKGKSVWVSEGFELARELCDAVNVPLGHGPVMTAQEQGLGIRD